MIDDKPLLGIKVVDLTIYAAGPAAGRLLADWGADVIKVESFKGDPMRDFGLTMSCPSIPEENLCWEIGNANKKSIALDLKTEKGQIIMDDLLAWADVFVTSNRTDALKRLRLDYETVSKKHPHLVWAQLNGWGDLGPLASAPGFDSVAFWARGGCMIDGPERNTAPMVTPIAFGDNMTGCTLAAGICSALIKKMRTGKGSKVQVSLFAQSIWCGAYMIGSTQYGKDIYPKSRRVNVSPLINSYCGSDGEWFFITILEYERYWNTFCSQVLERPDLIEDARFINAVEAMAHRTELIEILDDIFCTKPREHWMGVLEKADIAHSKIQHYLDIHKDPQAIANNYVYEIEHRNGNKSIIAGSPVSFGEQNTPEHKLAPLLGENTREVLEKIGYSENQIHTLYEEKIVL